MVPPGAGATEFGAAALLMFYSFTGFESIAVAAEDMENPQKYTNSNYKCNSNCINNIYIKSSCMCWYTRRFVI